MLRVSRVFLLFGEALYELRHFRRQKVIRRHGAYSIPLAVVPPHEEASYRVRDDADGCEEYPDAETRFMTHELHTRICEGENEDGEPQATNEV